MAELAEEEFELEGDRTPINAYVCRHHFELYEGHSTSILWLMGMIRRRTAVMPMFREAAAKSGGHVAQSREHLAVAKALRRMQLSACCILGDEVMREILDQWKREKHG